MLYNLLYIAAHNLEIQHIEAKKKITTLEENNERLQREDIEGWKAEDTHIEVMHDIVRMAKKEHGKKKNF